jgi:glycerol transport system ATP-binding protein
MAGVADGTYAIGFQPHHLSAVRPTAEAVALPAKVLVTEITGSESFVHVQFAGQRWVMLTSGIHIYQPDETLDVFIDPRHLMVFDDEGRAVKSAAQMAA